MSSRAPAAEGSRPPGTAGLRARLATAGGILPSAAVGSLLCLTGVGAAFAAQWLLTTDGSVGTGWDYFDRFTKREHPADFNTVLSHYLAREGPRYRYYLIGVDGPSLRYDTQHFLVPWVDGVDVGAKPMRLPVRQPSRGKGLVFVVEAWAPDGEQRLRAIESAYPIGRLGTHTDRLGELLFTSYSVAADQAVRAEGA